jgi:hypothetical protein
MDSTKSDFRKRKSEINEYFSFLDMLNQNKVSIEGEEVSRELQRIFIANTFLLLYNLIESTVRNSILEIYNKIQDDALTYTHLSPKIKQIWLEKKKKNIVNRLENVIEEIINEEIIILTNSDIYISGNIDAREIRRLADDIGFETSSNGRDLVSIKEKRNRLAHGEHTFHDVGKDFTYGDLNSYKENTFSHLEDVIEKIESFINNKKYKLEEE